MQSFILLCSVLCAFIVLANGNKTATWPPRVILQHYHLDAMVEKCLQLHNPDVKKLEEFELSDSIDNLPNDRSIKCFMHCMWVEFELLQPDSPVVDPTKFAGVMEHMETSEQNIYFKMFKKCNKKNKDLCEMVYQMNVCMKRNDNEHFYLIYTIPPFPV